MSYGKQKDVLSLIRIMIRTSFLFLICRELIGSFFFPDVVFFRMIPVDQVNGNAHAGKHQDGADTSFDAEVDIIEQAVPGRSRFQGEDRISGNDTAVRQTENDILRKVPCHMERHGNP